MIVVADAGPILHLYWVGGLAWGLPTAHVYVVEQVWTEVQRHAPEALGDARLQRIAAPMPDPTWRTRFSLQEGELAAMAFALSQPVALLLTDDEAARRACNALALAAVGTVGLVIEAARAGRVAVEEAIHALNDLPNKGRLHVSRSLLARAIAALEDDQK